MKIHERLRKARESKGVTQTYIAKKLGRTSAWYSNIERGERGLSAEDAKKIAEILQIDIRKIFFDNNLNTAFNNERTQETA